MIKCKKCGIDIPDESAFCPSCGATVDNADKPTFAAAPISQVLDLEKKRAETAARQEEADKHQQELARKKAESMVAEGPAKQTKPTVGSAPLKKGKISLNGNSAPDPQSPYALVSPSTYMWLSLIFAIPGIGLIFACIICLSSARYKNIANLAVGYVTMHLIVAVILAVFYLVLSIVNPLLLNRILNAFIALFDAFKEGLANSASPFPSATPFATPFVS